jgi:hypothetical protein
MADRVRTYRRADGTQVRQHSRAGQPTRPPISLRHAWDLLKRSRRAARRKKHGLALTLGLLGVGEGLASVALDGLSLAAVTAAVACLAVAAGGLSARGRFH